MKNKIIAFVIAFTFASIINAQSSIIGAETFTVNLPVNYSRTVGTNDYATVQWGNDETESYGFVIIEHFDELKLSDVSSDFESYMDLCVSKYSENPKFKSYASKLYKNNKGRETFQKQISYYNEELEATVYLQFNLFKSKNYIYQVVNFGNENFLEKYKESTHYIINNIDIPL